MQYIYIVLTALLSVAVLFLITKIIGYRQMSELSMFDYINGITIGSIASEVAISGKDDFLKPLIAMLIFGAFTLLLSFLTDVSMPARRFITGKPIILYQNGQLYYKNFKRARLDINEFLMQGRGKGYFELSQIETAILEPNGKISFLPRSIYKPVTPSDMKLSVKKAEIAANVVLDGKILERNLQSTGHSRQWLTDEVKKKTDVTLEKIMLATCMTDGTVEVYTRSNEKKQDSLE